MEFMLITVIAGTALLLRFSRPGEHRWPQPQSWFDIARNIK